jgi:hypothetical protein
MREQGLAFDSGHSSDLTIGQHLNLLDLAEHTLDQGTIEALMPRLALRLQHAINVDVITLGLYEKGAETIRLSVCKAGDVEGRCEHLPVHACASGRVWKNQRSILVQDLDTEPKLPAFLESLRRLGVHTYYVFPLTTSRHRLGAIGFGSLHVVPKTNATLDCLRRAAAMIAQHLDTTLSSDSLTAPTDCSANPLRRRARARTRPPGKLRSDSDNSTRHLPDEMVGNSAPLSTPAKTRPNRIVMRFTAGDIVHNNDTREDGRIVRIVEDLADYGFCYIVSLAPKPALGMTAREAIWRQSEVTHRTLPGPH